MINAILCWLGRHDWYNDGSVLYHDGYHATERLVQRCEQCFRVRFL